MSGDTICIGVPIHNGELYLRQALDSLVAQTHRDFRVVLLDDGSEDGSAAIAQEYADRDSRFILVRNATATGLVSAWRSVAEIAERRYRPAYFAWFSDHDWVSTDWLEHLYAALRDDLACVLAHARTLHVDAHGVATGAEGRTLDTTTMAPFERLRAVTLPTIGAGDAVYGLFRFDVLKRCDLFPREILPDLLVVSEASLHGTIRFAGEARRYRRVLAELNGVADMIRRQMRTLFLPGEQPARPHVSHATYFLRRFLAHDAGESPTQRMRRLYHALLFFHRQLNKYRVECEAELQSDDAFGDLSSVADFVRAVLNREWRLLYQDYPGLVQRLREAQARARRFKAMSQTLQAEIQALRAEMRLISPLLRWPGIGNGLPRPDHLPAEPAVDIVELDCALAGARARVAQLEEMNAELIRRVRELERDLVEHRGADDPRTA